MGLIDYRIFLRRGRPWSDKNSMHLILFLYSKKKKVPNKIILVTKKTVKSDYDWVLD
jgi:hypothetical protein